MKKLIAVALVLAAAMSTLAYGADQVIQYNEAMVGASHPTLADTLNRALLVDHETDGTHSASVIGSSQVTDNSLVNADINSAAAIDATKIADGTVTSGEFQYLGDVTSAIQAQFTAKAPLASPTFTGTVTAPTVTIGASDGVSGGAIDNTSIGVTTPAAGHFSTLDATGTVDLLSNASTGGVHTFQGGSIHTDNQWLAFGSDSDYLMRYLDTTKQWVFSSTDNGSTMTDTNAAFYFKFASGVTIDPGQRIFAIAKDSDNTVFYVDADGNMDIPGTAYVGEIQTDCSYDAKTCYMNPTNNGRPSDVTAGNVAHDNTTKELLVADGTKYHYGQFDALEYVIGNGTDAITTGQKGHIEVPYPCDIQSIRLFADASGSIVVDLWKDTYASFPPTVADNVTGTGTKPTLSSAQKSELTSFANYTTTTFAAGDVIAYNVDSVNTVKRVTISIRVRK